MALRTGSKYINSNVPVTGSPVTGVATTSSPVPTSPSAGQVMTASTGPLTLLLASAATSDTYRAFILPANHVITDWTVEVATTAAAGAFTIGVLGQACAASDGGTALTIDAIAANSTFSQSVTVQSAGLVRRTLIIPAVTTNAVTKNASVAIPVSYDRVIGIVTGTAITTNDAVVNITFNYAAV